MLSPNLKQPPTTLTFIDILNLALSSQADLEQLKQLISGLVTAKFHNQTLQEIRLDTDSAFNECEEISKKKTLSLSYLRSLSAILEQICESFKEAVNYTTNPDSKAVVNVMGLRANQLYNEIVLRINQLNELEEKNTKTLTSPPSPAVSTPTAAPSSSSCSSVLTLAKAAFGMYPLLYCLWHNRPYLALTLAIAEAGFIYYQKKQSSSTQSIRQSLPPTIAPSSNATATSSAIVFPSPLTSSSTSSSSNLPSNTQPPSSVVRRRAPK